MGHSIVRTKMKMKKIEAVVFDIDDTMLDFSRGFRDYANHYHGLNLKGMPDKHSLASWFTDAPALRDVLLRRFNVTWQFGCLKALPGAVKYLQRFSRANKTLENPIKLILLSKCGSISATQALRKANLTNVFGMMFDDIIMIDHEMSKKHILQALQGTHEILLCVDDYVQNCREMVELGIPTVVMAHSTNANVHPRYDIPVAQDWQDLHMRGLRPLIEGRCSAFTHPST